MLKLQMVRDVFYNFSSFLVERDKMSMVDGHSHYLLSYLITFSVKKKAYCNQPYIISRGTMFDPQSFRFKADWELQCRLYN